jgi:hypothetical protein
MHDLQLVGVHDDGEHLVLVAADGQRYRVPIDEPLRAAVRRDRARLGQLQIEIEGGLRPRDIQARIRAGESAEEVAESAGLPLEHVRRYEGPVLAEREHVADLARRLPARQVRSRPPFGDLVAERLTARGVDASASVWDAWRREGSTWTVQLSFTAGGRERRAQWAYDVQRSHLEPLDDEARWLSADASENGPLPGRRLTAVSERVYDVEADGGVRPAVAAADDPTAEPVTHGAGGARTLDLLDALRGRRGRRQPVLPLDDEDDQVDLTDAEPTDETGPHLEAISLPPAAHPPASRPDEAVDAEVLALPETAADEPAERAEDHDAADEPEPAATAPAEDAAPTDEPAAKATGEPAQSAEPKDEKPSAAGRSSARNRRASVPSWDEIVFGAKRE